MIVCPKCDTENADNANHCGNCGSQIQKGTGQKTMFGFAAVSAADMQKAAAEAKASAAAAKAGAPAPLPKPSLPSPGGSIPSPGGTLPKPAPTPGAGGLPAPNAGAKFNIPAPGGAISAPGAKTEVHESVASDPFADTAAPGSGLRTPEKADAPAPAPQPKFQAAPKPTSTVAEPTQPEMDSPMSNLPSSAPQAPMQPSSGGFNNNPGGSGGGGGGGPIGGGGKYQAGEVRDPVKTLVLVYVTCGLYGFILFMKVFAELNAGLGEERFSLMKELGLTIITCGLYGILLQWNICNAIVELQEKWGVQPEMDAPILFITNIFYVGPFFIQKSLNNAWENGRPPA